MVKLLISLANKLDEANHIKIANYIDILINITKNGFIHFIKTSADITDINQYKEQKEKNKIEPDATKSEETKEKSQMTSFLDGLSEAIGTDNVIDIIHGKFKLDADKIYEARKKLNFPPWSDKIPPLVKAWLSLADNPNKKERNANFRSTMTFILNDKQIEEEEKNKDKTKFNERAKRGMLRWEDRNDWPLDYPMIAEDWKMKFTEQHLPEAAKKYLQRKYKLKVLENNKKYLLPEKNNAEDFPVGTKIYQENGTTDRKFYTNLPIEAVKISDNEWTIKWLGTGAFGEENEGKTFVVDDYSNESINKIYFENTWRTNTINKPIESIVNEMWAYQPAEEEINDVLNWLIKTYGTEVIYMHSFKELNELEFPEDIAAGTLYKAF